MRFLKRLGGFDDALELIGALGPFKGAAMLIVLADIVFEKGFQLACGFMDRVLEALSGEDTAEHFYQINPRGMSWGVMHRDVGVVAKPIVHRLVAVRIEVIHDQV